jgi:hypothetical protein
MNDGRRSIAVHSKFVRKRINVNGRATCQLPRVGTEDGQLTYLDAQRSCRGTHKPVTRLQKVDFLDATPLLPLSSRILAYAAFSPDGNTLALASRERGVQLFRAVPFEKVSAQPNPLNLSHSQQRALVAPRSAAGRGSDSTRRLQTSTGGL